MKFLKMLLIGLTFFALTANAFAEDKPYKDGPVVEVTFVKIKPGRYDDYMRFLDTSYKAQMEAFKKAGIVLDYAVFSTQARTPQDADLILSVTYPNMAALDRTEEADAIAEKLMGSIATMNKATESRGVMREILGGQLMRQVILK
jgi:hypothetical protein